MKPFPKIIAEELNIPSKQIIATMKLLADGSTIPFIARYRKETTGLLNEIQITAIRDRKTQLVELKKRQNFIIESLAKRNLLNNKLSHKILTSSNLRILEDIYLPYRPKRKTKGTIAREKGLEPLAQVIFAQNDGLVTPSNFINLEIGVKNKNDALTGARNIIAEWINENQVIRASLRELFEKKAIISSSVIKKNKETGINFRDYFQWEELAVKTPSHRFLAMLRGENEKVLKISVRPPEFNSLSFLHKQYVKNNNISGQQIFLAINDCYKRLLGPSLENELRKKLKEKAEIEAIKVFALNLKEILLLPPLGRKTIMALDPAFRTGAKLVCLDKQGNLLHCCTIYPTHCNLKKQEASDIVVSLCNKHKIEAIAIGNGTAGRETEYFIRTLPLPDNLIITMVDESGASIYSASEVARAEFPDYDLTVRGAISIGRRLQDPLAELVKLDPKVIGVGQYQHDINQIALEKSLNDVVVSCVNNVGVELNTASVKLLSFVSGLSQKLAKNIVSYRNKNGPFKNRQSLLKVPRLGYKAFEQCAGFLRIHGAKNPLDCSGIHPEQYIIVKRIAKDLCCKELDLIEQGALRKKIDVHNYVTSEIGLPTLNDILAELSKPSRDPRDKFSVFSFEKSIKNIRDLQLGMKIPGLITNITNFGAFVDIGIHQYGLIYISQLANRFIKDPADVVKVRQQVMVYVIGIDLYRKRIALSLSDENKAIKC